MADPSDLGHGNNIKRGQSDKQIYILTLRLYDSFEKLISTSSEQGINFTVHYLGSILTNCQWNYWGKHYPNKCYNFIMSIFGLDSGTSSGKRGIFDPIPCLVLIRTVQQNIGNMVPVCCNQITGATSDSLVDHIRLHMQEASLSRNPLVYWEAYLLRN